jgi:hypothetical protein
VNRNLDDVAGQHTGGTDSGTLGTGIGDGHARTSSHETTGDSGSGDDLLDHFSSLLAKRPQLRTAYDTTTSEEAGYYRPDSFTLFG